MIWRSYPTVTGGNGMKEMKAASPCKDCKIRYVACHDNCMVYKKWKDARPSESFEEHFKRLDGGKNIVTRKHGKMMEV